MGRLRRFPRPQVRGVIRSIFILLTALALLGAAWLASAATNASRYLPIILRGWPTEPPQYNYPLISEVLYDPSIAEPDGEWIELYNSGKAAYDLHDYKLGDSETQGDFEGMYRFPAGSSLGPQQVIVVANKAAAFQSVFGFLPDYELVETSTAVPNLEKYAPWSTHNLELTDNGDEIVLLDASDQIVDAVSWGSSAFAFYPSVPKVAQGHSIERWPAFLDNDGAADWREKVLPDPGQVDLSVPTPTPSPTQKVCLPAQVLISEVLYDADGITEPEGEWVELFNRGDSAVNLACLRVGDEELLGGGEGMYRFPPGSELGAGEVLLVANRAAIFLAVYGFLPDYEFADSHPGVANMQKDPAWASGSINLSDSGDEVLVLDDADQLLDAVSWGTSTFAFAPSIPTVAPGHSLERSPAQLDSDQASDWLDRPVPVPGSVNTALSTATPTATKTPTPTQTPTATPTRTPTVPPVLVINEIHADPDISAGDANQDGWVDSSEDEFVEIVNITGSAVDLSGWRLKDNTKIRHQFPVGTVIQDGCAVVIFGGGSPAGEFGGALVQTASFFALDLSATADWVSLYDPENVLVLRYEYGSEAGNNQSITRDPDITGLPPLIPHLSAAGAGGRYHSAGTKVDGSLFPGCSINK